MCYTQCERGTTPKPNIHSTTHTIKPLENKYHFVSFHWLGSHFGPVHCSLHTSTCASHTNSHCVSENRPNELFGTRNMSFHERLFSSEQLEFYVSFRCFSPGVTSVTLVRCDVRSVSGNTCFNNKMCVRLASFTRNVCRWARTTHADAV